MFGKLLINHGFYSFIIQHPKHGVFCPFAAVSLHFGKLSSITLAVLFMPPLTNVKKTMCKEPVSLSSTTSVANFYYRICSYFQSLSTASTFMCRPASKCHSLFLSKSHTVFPIQSVKSKISRQQQTILYF